MLLVIAYINLEKKIWLISGTIAPRSKSSLSIQFFIISISTLSWFLSRHRWTAIASYVLSSDDYIIRVIDLISIFIVIII